MRLEKNDVLEKVHAIEANFDAHDLNISESNKQLLWNDVDVCKTHRSILLLRR